MPDSSRELKEPSFGDFIYPVALATLVKQPQKDNLIALDLWRREE